MQAQPGSLSAFLEKSAKYTKSWTKRYVTFDPDTRKMSYGVSSEADPKATMTVDVITRASERNAKLYRGSPDLFSFYVTGVLSDGKNDNWTFRCPEESSFHEWYDAVREAAAAQGMMQPIHCGLPKTDVRTQLDFVRVPLEYLFRFGALDRAILYYFGAVMVSRGEGQGAQEEILVIGDRSVYLFTSNAEITRCVPLARVRKVCLGTDFVAFVCAEPQHDMLLLTPNASRITEIFEKAALVVPDTQECVVEEVDSEVTAKIYSMLHLTAREEYSLTITTPTPKTRLKQAMDLYEKQYGRPYAPNEEAEEGSASAAPPSETASPKAGPAVDISDPMAALLMRLGLGQYAAALQQQHIDVDVLSCMDPEDLATFGIPDPEHREKIIAAAKGDELTSPIVAPAPVPVAKRPMITLDSDDDDLPLPVPKPAHINLDDDDDDLLPPPNAPVVLDDSDDDLPLPKPKPTVDLSDDDDLPVPKPAAPPVVPDLDEI